MDDYFDRVAAQLGELTKHGAHSGVEATRGWRRPRRGRAAIPVLVSALVVVVVAALLLATHATRRPMAFGGVATRPGAAPATSPPTSRDPNLVFPGTYGTAACDNAAAVCDPRTRLPAVMQRPMQFGLIASGRTCRATRPTRLHNSYIGGIALGGAADPVRLVIANLVDVRLRTIELGTTSTPGWGAIKVVWVAAHAYQGPFVIRAQPLQHSGPIRIGTGGPPPAGPLVVAAGPTLNSGRGYRTLPSGVWVRHPGCYGVQVDGVNFTSDFTVHVVAHRRRSP